MNLKRRISGYIDLIRPFTLLAPIIVSICIMMASFFYNGGTGDLFASWWMIILPASFSLAILNGASNALNQVTDLETDKISKPYRPIVRGDISTGEAKAVSLILYIVAFSLAIMVNVVFCILTLLITLSSNPSGVEGVGTAINTISHSSIFSPLA